MAISKVINFVCMSNGDKFVLVELIINYNIVAKCKILFRDDWIVLIWYDDLLDRRRIF